MSKLLLPGATVAITLFIYFLVRATMEVCFRATELNFCAQICSTLLLQRLPRPTPPHDVASLLGHSRSCRHQFALACKDFRASIFARSCFATLARSLASVRTSLRTPPRGCAKLFDQAFFRSSKPPFTVPCLRQVRSTNQETVAQFYLQCSAPPN